MSDRPMPAAGDLVPRGFCVCCQFSGLPTGIYQPPNNMPLELCRLCAKTVAGRAYRNYAAYGPVVARLSGVICFCANEILAELGAFDEWRARREVRDE